jgi:excisionase family DNA binding protein
MCFVKFNWRKTGMNTGARITVNEIAARLSIGRAAVYKMLEDHIVPGIRLGNRWLVTRNAYEAWERRCGQGNASWMDANGATA